MERLSSVRVINDQFQFNPRKKYVWLQKLIFWIAKKLNCYVETVDITETLHEVDHEKLFDMFMQQYFEVCERYKKRPTKVYIGVLTYNRIFNTDFIDQRLRIETEIFNRNEINGLEIVLVLWIDGIFIPPPDLK
jgi:hypothetical protein